MADTCYRIVRWFGSLWETLGWLLFIVMFMVFATGTPYSSPPLGILTGLLLILWWIVDVVDQGLEWWKITFGAVLVALSFAVPTKGFISVSFLWIGYFFRLRGRD